jgi:uncharacterized membrane protein YidH (DUF202 family)
MQATLTGFAALALLGFGLAFALLMLFMALVQPVWSVIDCAVDDRRGTLGKLLWILALVLLWGVANWFYGAFAAANKGLLRLTRLAWALAIGLMVAFLVVFNMNAEFRRGVEKEWRNYGGGLVVHADPATDPRIAHGLDPPRARARSLAQHATGDGFSFDDGLSPPRSHA